MSSHDNTRKLRGGKYHPFPTGLGHNGRKEKKPSFLTKE